MYKTDLTSVYYDIHRKGIVGEMVPITSTIRWPAILDHDATSAYVHIAMKVFIGVGQSDFFLNSIFFLLLFSIFIINSVKFSTFFIISVGTVHFYQNGRQKS